MVGGWGPLATGRSLHRNGNFYIYVSVGDFYRSVGDAVGEQDPGKFSARADPKLAVHPG